MNRIQLPILLSAVLILGSLVCLGCSSESSNKSADVIGDQSGTDTVVQCQSDGQCAVDQACRGGKCVPAGNVGGNCKFSTECDGALVCNRFSGKCVECRTGADCGAGGGICQDGSCKAGQACQSDLQCAEFGMVCNGYACVPCKADADCPDGVCLSNTCVPSIICESSLDCASVTSICAEVYREDTDENLSLCLECNEYGSDCPAQSACVDNLCYEVCEGIANVCGDILGVSCGECPSGEYCENNTCIDGCEGYVCGSGRGGEPCGSCSAGMICTSRQTECVECMTNEDCVGNPDGPSCGSGQCGPCEYNSDCSSGLPICVSGECRECGSDADCYGLTCDTLTGTCVECVDDAACGDWLCLADEQRCVACLSNFDCTDSSDGPRCNQVLHSCAPACVTNSDCIGDPNGPRCDPVAKACGGCVVDSDCSGSPYEPFCRPGGGACVECVTHAQCASNPSGPFCEAYRYACSERACDPDPDHGELPDGWTYTDTSSAGCYPYCGNGSVDSGEECDDGNTVSGDGCAESCLWECGNGWIDGSEQCDDWNRIDGDGCAANCMFECSGIGVAANIGSSCDVTDPTFCGQGGACIQLYGASGPSCFKMCAVGLCEASCTGDEVCLGISNAQGDPMELAPGINAGACIVPFAGNGPYAQCGAAGLDPCGVEFDCLAMQGANSGYCAPRCESGQACPVQDSITGTCIISTSGSTPTHCALPCNVVNPTCPTGMGCTSLGGGNGICAWP